jgi:hypothetical protein
MNIQSKSFNWVSSPSAWQSMQTWRARRSAMADDAISTASAFGSAVATAHINQSSGLGNLAAKAAIKRIQDKILAAQQAKLHLSV